jgi:hypothetical protein
MFFVLYRVGYFVDDFCASVHVANEKYRAVVEDWFAESSLDGLERQAKERCDLRMRHSDVIVE